MRKLAITAAVLLAVPAFAQQPAQHPAAPLAASGVPDLKVASVTLQGGRRVSRVIGVTVANEQGQQIGTIDDLIMTQPGKLGVAVISVGGFLGIGSKLVAVPYEDVRFDKDGHAVLPGATKEALNALPNFTYGG